MNFMNALKNTLDEDANVSLTENGAIGYRTSGKALLDINFAVSSLRSASENEIARKFIAAFAEDKVLAVKWLFFARDARQGLGERRLFRVILSSIVKSNPEIVQSVIELVPEYGRWDDLLCLLDCDNTQIADSVINLISHQLAADLENCKANKPISLLAKWLPSTNASSAQTKKYARQICKALHFTERNYRKILSQLRAYLKVVEVNMSAKQWSEIEYDTVPSRANLIYNNAFLRNDEERRRAYLGSLEKGEVKINASVLYPHDIAHKYGFGYSGINKAKDATVEALWKALPDTVKGCGNTIVVADGSGSMTSAVGGGSSVRALEVAAALAIYFAEHSSGEFKDKYITFSENPRFVDFSHCTSLHDKLRVAYSHDEVANTNIEKVFDLILTTAIRNHSKQEDLPKNILIISDMEFDSCATSGTTTPNGYWEPCIAPDAKLFNNIKQRYRDAGYQMPRLIFWNVCSRTGTIPIKENDLGVALVSGFSTNVAKMVMSGKLDPYECLLETLNSERYFPVEEALQNA